MPNLITSFDGKYEFLSNFFPAIVSIDGMRFPTVEHAFQAAKTDRPSEKLAIQQAKTPGQAKRMGRKVSLIEEWDDVKDSIMLYLLRQKFCSGSSLAEDLVETRNTTLVEGNVWHDTYWGVCTCPKCGGRGANVLGQLLMYVRTGNLAPTKGVITIDHRKRRWLS